MLKIPVMEFIELRSCGIKKKTEMAELLLSTSVIIYDEVVKAKNTVAALEVTSIDITKRLSWVVYRSYASVTLD